MVAMQEAQLLALMALEVPSSTGLRMRGNCTGRAPFVARYSFDNGNTYSRSSNRFEQDWAVLYEALLDGSYALPDGIDPDEVVAGLREDRKTLMAYEDDDSQ